MQNAEWERRERCLWQRKRPERETAVGERGRRSAADENTGHRNRNGVAFGDYFNHFPEENTTILHYALCILHS